MTSNDDFGLIAMRKLLAWVLVGGLIGAIAAGIIIYLLNT
jgi:hypothetical protein